MIQDYVKEICENNLTKLQKKFHRKIDCLDWSEIIEYLEQKKPDYRRELINQNNRNENHNALIYAILCKAPRYFIDYMYQNIGRELNDLENNFLEEVTNEKNETSFSFELAISIKYNYSNIVHLILKSFNYQSCKELILAKDPVGGNCLLHYAGQKESSHMLEIILFHLKRSDADIDYVITNHLNNNNNTNIHLYIYYYRF